MNVTLNTNKFNTYNRNNSATRQQIPTFPGYREQIPTFGSAGSIVSNVSSTIPKKSGLFKNIKKAYGAGIDFIAKYFTAPLVDSKPINYMAEKFKNSKYLFNHLLAVGSAITSGMYMYKTLKMPEKKPEDRDRKKTLALNQFLTFALSTAGAYLIDSKLGNWWDKQTAKFAGLRLNDPNLAKEFVETNEAIRANNKLTIETNKGKVSKKDLKLLLDDTEMVKDFVKTRNNFKSMLPKQKRALLNQVEGMGLLKTMIVFGAVYRYFVPVLVTPIANKIGEKYLNRKKEANAQAQIQQNQQQTKKAA